MPPRPPASSLTFSLRATRKKVIRATNSCLLIWKPNAKETTPFPHTVARLDLGTAQKPNQDPPPPFRPAPTPAVRAFLWVVGSVFTFSYFCLLSFSFSDFFFILFFLPPRSDLVASLDFGRRRGGFDGPGADSDKKGGILVADLGDASRLAARGGLSSSSWSSRGAEAFFLEMGSCWSARIKAVSPFNSISASGVNSNNASRDGYGLNSSSSRASSASVPSLARSEVEILQSPNLKCFTFGELRVATRNFRPDSVLGEGGFGSVFKGWIDENSLSASRPGTGIVIAVKKLNLESFQGHREWLAEVNYLGQLCHPNLVKLIGYCLEDEQRLLVYEFMPRGSLENHLFRRGSHFQPLSWKLRMKVALGAAKGLAYLHSDETKVIYRDFKTSNVLLDTNYNAKLSDFGLAKDGPTGDKSHVSTRVMGTYGYAAPEYLATGHLTTKNDVYSFGVVLLELISGRRALDKNRPHGEQNLVEWARPYLSHKRKIYLVLDNRLEGQYSHRGVQKVGTLALHCLSADPRFRPTMSEVVTVLEEIQEVTVASMPLPAGRGVTVLATAAAAVKGRNNSSRASSGRRIGDPDCGQKVAAYPRPSASPLYL